MLSKPIQNFVLFLYFELYMTQTDFNGLGELKVFYVGYCYTALNFEGDISTSVPISACINVLLALLLAVLVYRFIHIPVSFVTARHV